MKMDGNLWKAVLCVLMSVKRTPPNINKHVYIVNVLQSTKEFYLLYIIGVYFCM